MKTQVLFIHGGGDDGYGTDKALMHSLKNALGENYELQYPQMNTENENDLALEWIAQIEAEILKLGSEVILVGHSLGASMIIKYLSEKQAASTIKGVFLLAPPFWSGNRTWVQPLKLKKNFEEQLPPEIPLFFYQCKDDEIVPYRHFTRYRKILPAESFREVLLGGHQFNNDLALLAMDIIAISMKWSH